jgi:glycosyltransferase involved in cell wall biosynthesis
MSVHGEVAARPEISVIVPVYGNERTLAALHRRVASALDGRRFEIVFVNDASPDGSAAVLDGLARTDPRVRVVAIERNRGQHAAVLAGMRSARGSWVAALDADLQDPPEAIPALVGRGRQGFDVVFAGRRGAYEPRRRLLTSRLFKLTLSAICNVPRDAGMFLAVRNSAVQRVLAMQGPPPQLVAMIGRAGLRTTSIPVERAPRNDGASSYSGAMRLGSALRAFRWGIRRGSFNGASQLDAHNEVQRSYYANAAKPNLVPRRSRYLERHVDELVDFAGLRPGDRVLEVGCGMGRYMLILAERGFRMEGIDISPELLEGLRRHAAGRFDISLHEADIVNPPAGLAGQFDAVVGLFALHHLHEVGVCIRSMAGLLVPGGTVAFLEPNP